ncbi:hypothetical protein BWQ96_09804 [Gracilariopsis chorda]|uniref:Uncharacterized protein n=1 Tax=Gracilariopsis chorda TaxID=448386 RepID=A0A2V3IEK6_9FLOR|nr:hypothetical protein BWQ96_09804 [Gracilariopsis chorda]|eukprot:PXF40481.1 hypothetical protein BWQ96_09804 [Gracilariopsis chorda]
MRGTAFLLPPHVTTSNSQFTINLRGKPFTTTIRLCSSRTVSRAALRVFRPTLDDVERLSRGQAARRRGTGSRAVPHRLNQEERRRYERAQKSGVLELPANAGYRRERQGSPILNIWRQWCDAQARPAVYCLCELTGLSSLIVDVSTLRADYSAFEVPNGDIRQLKAVLDREMEIPGILEAEQISAEVMEDAIWKVPCQSFRYEYNDLSQAKKMGRRIGSYCLERVASNGDGKIAAVASVTKTRKTRPGKRPAEFI